MRHVKFLQHRELVAWRHEWLVEKDGTAKWRAWHKLHIGIDADSGEIVAFDLTDKDVDDASHVEPLLEQLIGAPASFTADGAYDRAATYDAILARNPFACFIVPPCKGAVPGRLRSSRQPSATPWTNMGG